MFRALMRRAAAGAAAVPSRCLVCHAWPARTFCDDCVERFARPVARCPLCALQVPNGIGTCGACIASAPPLDACHAAVSYGYPWAHAIGQLKFGAQPGLARPLALLLRSAPWIEPALDSAELLIPMPLSRERLRERGYNQAGLLAGALAPAKLAQDILLRIRHTLPNSGLNRAARIAAMRAAFAVDPLQVRRIAGRRVLLVDDVMTSGASLFAAAIALRRAGVGSVSAIVVARTE